MLDDARVQEKKKGLLHGSQMGGHSRWCVRAGLMLLAVTVLSVGSVGVTLADDQPLPSMAIGYQNGAITAIYQTSFQIDGRTFSLTTDAVIVDDKGKQVDASELVVTAEVKFHVKKEESDKIDKMIVTLPR